MGGISVDGSGGGGYRRKGGISVGVVSWVSLEKSGIRLRKMGDGRWSWKQGMRRWSWHGVLNFKLASEAKNRQVGGYGKQ